MKPSLLVLKNFQSLRERTEIPIGPLTFLYGPNSAGKSSIDDAFTFLATVLHEGASKQEICAMVKRWRHFNFQSDEPQLGPDSNMLVELHFQTGAFRNAIYSGHAELQQLIESEEGLFGRFSKEQYRFVLAVECDRNGVSSVTISTESTLVFRLDFDSEEEDFGHLTIDLTPFGPTFRSLIEEHGISIDGEADRYSFDCIALFENRLRLTALNDGNIDWELAAVVNTLLLDLAALVSVPINLGADRQTIPNSCLTALCGLSPDYVKSPSLDLGLQSDPKFDFMRRLAASNFESAVAERQSPRISHEATDSTLEPASHELLTEVQEAFHSLASSRQLRPSTLEPIHSFVNRCLAEHLFLDQGYQLAFEALEILPATDIQVKPLSAALMVGSLIDKEGRRMTFQDVGTGISCLIPVLVAIHSGSSFIQQPELHLHPALQSAVGDIFVEASKVDLAFHFIETHSEYILLRCLRRVRETTKGIHPEGSPLALRPEDVRVLYFEPQPDGCTRVKSIRVSTQGDFIDRWPRGFFEERSKDLFDE